MGIKKPSDLERELEWLKPDNMDGTPEEFKAHAAAESALNRGLFNEVEKYIQETRGKFNTPKKQDPLQKV
jgi:hypothetical protein